MKKRYVILSLFSLVSLLACQRVTLLDMTYYQKTSSFDVIKKDENGEGYYRRKDYSTLEYGRESDRKEITSFRDIYSSGVNHYNAPSTGKIYS